MTHYAILGLCAAAFVVFIIGGMWPMIVFPFHRPKVRLYSDEDGIIMSADPDKHHRLVLTDLGWVSEDLVR